MTPKVQIHLELTDEQALALAQLIKRIPWTTLRENAKDAEEAYLMHDALCTVQWAMAEAGYEPR